jgi:hypothetical protein
MTIQHAEFTVFDDLENPTRITLVWHKQLPRTPKHSGYAVYLTQGTTIAIHYDTNHDRALAVAVARYKKLHKESLKQ